MVSKVSPYSHHGAPDTRWIARSSPLANLLKETSEPFINYNLGNNKYKGGIIIFRGISVGW